MTQNKTGSRLSGDQIRAAACKREKFSHLVKRFRAAKRPAEIKRLGDALGRFIFGE